MNSQSDGATDVSEETAPEQTGVVEQKETPSYEETLLQLAQEEGRIEPAKAVDQPPAEVPEVQDEQTDEEDETEVATEEEPEEEVEELKPAAEKDKLDKLVPLRDVVEERGKKQRANERAERAEAELAKAQADRDEARRQLSQAAGPMPTPDSPLIDIQDPIVLDRLERVYELLEETDIENVNEDGSVTVPSAIGADGKIVYAKIDPEQARLALKRADRVLRKDIPNRRKYLAERAQIDADAQQWYPDLKNGDHEFTRLVNDLTGKVLNGTAMSDPQVKFWAANAVYGFMKRKEESQAKNGKGTQRDVKTVVDASKRKFAPTASRTRAVVERKTSADLAAIEKRFMENPDDRDAAAAYAGAILGGKNARKTVQPVAE